ncbi:Eco29kI family restriction endonuclease [Amycolatopsis sp. GA6-003]|uniref:Eco29kI family restriction endonuclease n=1 Tax=Amycolatopsis sp. GA6-003 TaxID=2652444 RepID=UPI003916DF04
MEAAPSISLAHTPQSGGAGIYALYYAGLSELYVPVTSSALPVPIYVGRAAGPSGDIRSKVKCHRIDIESCENLSVDEFQVRYLPVEEIWAHGALRLMVGDHRPLWNVAVTGFGARDPGRERRRQSRPNWDVLHPGRTWAAKMAAGRRTAKELRAVVRRNLSN